MVNFLHDAGFAVYDAFFSFDAASTTPLVKTVKLSLVTLDAWTVSVVYFLREKNCSKAQ